MGRPAVCCTEFVDGGTLSNWAAAQPRSWREIVELLTGVAEGLAAAHEARILHRDIKPANILVSQSGYAKLADFGLAKLAESPGSDDATRTGTGVIVGTTAYMSPEQAKGLECDARSDIFSLGVVLYEMLAGRRPFEGRSSPETLQKIVHEQAPPLSDKIPASLRDLVEKALEKEPQDRYQAVREMVVDLRRIARRAESAVPAASATPRSPWWIAAASLLFVVVLAAVVAGIVFRPNTTTERSERLQIEPPPGGRFVVGSTVTVGGIAVSPDGRSLAFVATVNDTD
jgi:eukaryotic-like serine/threonine-protein kinase